MVEHPAVLKGSFPMKVGLKNRVNSGKPKLACRHCEEHSDEAILEHGNPEPSPWLA